jgi:hypothetical protein
MSDGLHLFIGKDGSQTLFEANTDKRYTLLEKNYPLGNINYQYQPYNYEYYHDVSQMPVQHTDQIRYTTPQS